MLILENMWESYGNMDKTWDIYEDILFGNQTWQAGKSLN